MDSFGSSLAKRNLTSSKSFSIGRSEIVMSAVHTLRFVFPMTSLTENKRSNLRVAISFYVSVLSASFASRMKDLGFTVVLVVSEFLTSLTWKIVDIDGMRRGS